MDNNTLSPMFYHVKETFTGSNSRAREFTTSGWIDIRDFLIQQLEIYGKRIVKDAPSNRRDKARVEQLINELPQIRHPQLITGFLQYCIDTVRESKYRYGHGQAFLMMELRKHITIPADFLNNFPLLLLLVFKYITLEEIICPGLVTPAEELYMELEAEYRNLGNSLSSPQHALKTLKEKIIKHPRLNTEQKAETVVFWNYLIPFYVRAKREILQHQFERMIWRADPDADLHNTPKSLCEYPGFIEEFEYTLSFVGELPKESLEIFKKAMAQS